jgi:tetratricopeptide (TPR) repeat protein
MSEPTGVGAPTDPLTGTGSSVPRKDVARRWLSWHRLELWVKRIFAVATRVLTGAVLIWVAVLTCQRHTVVLQPITVPEALAKAGFTDQVATQRLADEIHAIRERAKSSLFKMSDVQLHPDTADITIPNTGISVDSIVTALRRDVVPDSWKHEVSGEFTSKGAALSLRLRNNGRLVFAGEAANLTGADALVRQAALSVVKAVDPYIAASALLNDGDLQGANAVTDEIIDSSPAGSENLQWATYLKGLIAIAEKHDEDAAALFAHLPDRSLGFFGMGSLRDHRGRLMEAADAYREALLHESLDRIRVFAHNNLGNVWLKDGKEEDAKAEYRAAIRLDPTYAMPHNNLGAVWDKQGKEEDAITEYRAAIRLEPTYALPHIGLGDVWDKQGKEEDAIAEYRAAIGLNPRDARAHYDLGLALRRLAGSGTDIPKKTMLLIDACQALTQGSKLASTDLDFSALMHQIDGQLPGVSCVVLP